MEQLSEKDVVNTEQFCKRFLKPQRPICNKYVGLIPSVLYGISVGIQECRYQFSNHHWNCAGHNLSTPVVVKLKRQHRNTYFDNLIEKGVPESAFLLAMTSASVAHQVTKACSTGTNSNCGCDRTTVDIPNDNSFQWAGCNENVDYGAAFSKQFLDVAHKQRTKKQPKLRLVNLHNSHTGTKVKTTVFFILLYVFWTYLLVYRSS